VNALTRVAIKRAKRLHPGWMGTKVLEHIKTLTDAAGPYRDTVTLEDVRGVIASMEKNKQEGLL